MKVIKVITGAKDLVLKNLVEDILDILWSFKKIEFSFVPKKKLNGTPIL